MERMPCEERRSFGEFRKRHLHGAWTIHDQSEAVRTRLNVESTHLHGRTRVEVSLGKITKTHRETGRASEHMRAVGERGEARDAHGSMVRVRSEKAKQSRSCYYRTISD